MIIDVACLPSSVRVCMNVIAIPQAGSSGLLKKPIQSSEDDSYIVEGLVLGSISLSVFDSHFKLRQGFKSMCLWPFIEFNPRMVCAGEYHVK